MFRINAPRDWVFTAGSVSDQIKSIQVMNRWKYEPGNTQHNRSMGQGTLRGSSLSLVMTPHWIKVGNFLEVRRNMPGLCLVAMLGSRHIASCDQGSSGLPLRSLWNGQKMNEVAPPETVSPGACFLGAFRLPSPSSAATNWSGFCQFVVIRPVQPKENEKASSPSSPLCSPLRNCQFNWPYLRSWSRLEPAWCARNPCMR